MAYTKKGTLWELKNTLFLLLSFIPFVNSICLFHMDGKVGNKKWRKLGWIILFINIVFVVTYIICSNFMYYDVEELPDNRPKISDYLGRDYFDKYTFDEYSKLPEYYEYEEALDNWFDSAEVQRVMNRNESFTSIIMGISRGIFIGILTLNWVVFFYVISQRASYLKELVNDTNKKDIISRLENLDADNSPTNYENENEHTANNNANSIKRLDLNKATEEEISDLPGLTIVDAKRAVKYREEHNGFSSKDEFYTAIGVKPHILVKLEDIIIINKKNNNKETTHNNKRRIDL